MIKRYKLGTTRAGPRSRIWLDGANVRAAGFEPGTRYIAAWNDGTLSLTPWDGEPVSGEHVETRKVSGHAKPIIDIVGARVVAEFGAFPHVLVSFQTGRILISRND